MNTICSRYVFGALVLTVLLVPAVPAWAITNGEIDTENDYDNVGALVMDRDPAIGPPIVFSTGTLVHERILLTAAHSIDFIDQQIEAGHTPDEFHVSFDVDARDGTIWLAIADIIVDPDYNHYEGQDGNANPHDLALVILAAPVDVTPALLPSPGLLDDLHHAGLLETDAEGGSPLTAVGYGRTLVFPPPETISIDGFRRFAETEYLGLTQAYLMALKNPAVGYGGSANGDSGGPLFWTAPTGEEVLVGVHLWSDAERVALTAEYRVDIPETLDFIACVCDFVDAGEL